MRIDTVLLKVASRCNLDCSYCYVYNMGDEAWRSLPKRMPDETQAAVVEQLGRLYTAQASPFAVVLHGGEPLLIGASQLAKLLSALRTRLPANCSINIQTNGVLITPAILDICVDHGVSLSVSLDGPAEVHDACRVDLRGRATHAQVIAGLDRLKSHARSSELFSGLLAVVDPASDPVAVYDYFRLLHAPSVDFLYRDGNRSRLPQGKASLESLEYGRWMCALLDRYLADPAPLRIRILDDMMKLILGGAGRKEGIGITDFGIVVIDTDGAVTKNDTLKSTPLGDRFEDSWSVHTHDLATVVTSEAFSAYHLSQRPSSPVCAACPDIGVCGGGMVTHRFDARTGYANPTVFCADQKLLIARMRRYLGAHLRQRAVA